jgi:hypothetical protein
MALNYNMVDDVMMNINQLYDMIHYQISLFVVSIFEIYIYNVNTRRRSISFMNKIGSIILDGQKGKQT